MNAGAQLSILRLCGGQSRNPIWNQMKANASGLILEELENPEAELLGGLCASLFALGEYDSISGASEKTVRVKRQYLPAR
jgi:xylulokinase